MEALQAGFVSAVLILILERFFDFLRDKRKRKETKEDKAEDKKEAEDNKILRAIGEMREELGEVKDDVNTLRTDVENVRREAEEGRIIERRIRILHFADEITHKTVFHSKDNFQQAMDDCRYYEEYVNKHPDFKNGMTDPAIKLIRETYDERLRKNDFL